jgi:hypothetical protein
MAGRFKAVFAVFRVNWWRFGEFADRMEALERLETVGLIEKVMPVDPWPPPPAVEGAVMIDCKICGCVSGVPHDRVACPVCKRNSPAIAAVAVMPGLGEGSHHDFHY